MDAPAAWIAAEIGLRLLGAFYLFAGIVGARRCASDFLLTQAIAAITMKETPETRTERARGVFLFAMLLPIGVGGVALLALLDAAPWLFAASFGAYALYLLVLAPRLFDPLDPPEEPGRSQSWNAFFVYGAATALVFAGWRAGLLAPTLSAPPAILVLASALALGFVAYAVRLMNNMRLSPRPGAWTRPPEADDERPPFDLGTSLEERAERLARFRLTRVMIMPTWDEFAYFDAETGEALPWPLPVEDVPPAVELHAEAWLDLFMELADPHDPHRCALKDEADRPRIEAAGRPLVEALVACLGEARVEYRPRTLPRPPKHRPRAIRIAPETGCHALWDDDTGDNLATWEIGISVDLAREWDRWSAAFDGSIDWSDPGGGPAWTPTRFAEHAAAGRSLAARLRAELDATGRDGTAIRLALDMAGERDLRAAS